MAPFHCTNETIEFPAKFIQFLQNITGFSLQIRMAIPDILYPFNSFVVQDAWAKTRKRMNSALYLLRPNPSTIFAEMDFEDRRS